MLNISFFRRTVIRATLWVQIYSQTGKQQQKSPDLVKFRGPGLKIKKLWGGLLTMGLGPVRLRRGAAWAWPLAGRLAGREPLGASLPEPDEAAGGAVVRRRGRREEE